MRFRKMSLGKTESLRKREVIIAKLLTESDPFENESFERSAVIHFKRVRRIIPIPSLKEPASFRLTEELIAPKSAENRQIVQINK